MTQYSYSRVDLFTRCPFHYKIKYLDQLTELPRYDAVNPLFLGHALHKGIESGAQAMIDDYINAYPVVTDNIVNELMKLELLLPKVTSELSEFSECKFEHEVEVSVDNFIGYADLIMTDDDGISTLLDFKYSNHVENYMGSGQLHLYRYYLNKLGYNVQHMGYLFIPKSGIRQKKTEDLFQFRKRLETTVSKQKVHLVPIEYDENQVIYFQNKVEQIRDTTEFPRNVTGDCFACNPHFAPNYLEMIDKGEIQMVLIPKNELKEKKVDLNPDVWLYADSYVGKTTFWDKFDDVLFINTDGNTDNIRHVPFKLKDKVTKEGRITKRKFAWETFLELIQDLEIENTEGYKTIVLDLVEDLRNHCRNYVFDKYGWEHESDGTYGKGWSMVTREFDNAIKRLKMIGLQVVYISKELRSDVTLKGGSVRTTFKPNIDDKTANFLTGTVDITMRAYVNDDDEHKLILKKESNMFGGGRYEFKQKEIPLEKDAFLNALKDAQGKEPERKAVSSKPKTPVTTNDEAEPKSVGEPEPLVEEEKPKRKRKPRKPRTDEESVTPPGEPVDTTVSDEDIPTEEQAAKPRRRRRRRTESEGEK